MGLLQLLWFHVCFYSKHWYSEICFDLLRFLWRLLYLSGTGGCLNIVWARCGWPRWRLVFWAAVPPASSDGSRNPSVILHFPWLGCRKRTMILTFRRRKCHIPMTLCEPGLGDGVNVPRYWHFDIGIVIFLWHFAFLWHLTSGGWECRTCTMVLAFQIEICHMPITDWHSPHVLGWWY